MLPPQGWFAALTTQARLMWLRPVLLQGQRRWPCRPEVRWRWAMAEYVASATLWCDRTADLHSLFVQDHQELLRHRLQRALNPRASGRWMRSCRRSRGV
jgi:hypothetical protein